MGTEGTEEVKERNVVFVKVTSVKNPDGHPAASYTYMPRFVWVGLYVGRRARIRANVSTQGKQTGLRGEQ